MFNKRLLFSIAIIASLMCMYTLAQGEPLSEKRSFQYPLDNVPAQMPAENAEHGPLLYGELRPEEKAAVAEAAHSPAGFITVTAVVLPVRQIMIEGNSLKVMANMGAKEESLYAVTQEGKKIALTEEIWRDFHKCLAKATSLELGQVCSVSRSS